jgi:hypothetical protein
MGHYDPMYHWGEKPPDGNHATRLCHTVSADMVDHQPAHTYLWRGTYAEEDNSVFSVLSTAADKGLVFYNGDVGDPATHRSGIRAMTVDAETLAVDLLLPDPLEPDTVVDPHAVFLEGGGVRVYATNLDSHPDGVEPGVVYFDLDERLRRKGPVRQALVSPGNCHLSGDWSCGCVLDPAFIRLKDGRMVMYTGFLEDEGKQVCSLNLRRFFAVD